MGLEDDGFLYLKDANGQDDMTFPVMPRYTSQESNFGTLYLPDNGPWITQNMDMAPPPPKDAHSSSATQSSSLESALSSNSRAPASRVKVPLPSIRQRTAQACDKCRERKTKVRASY
ncbi:hypothetical protein BYT27DRAFT_6919889 [Phlegmacium glaucopus]|nr:hypothetical protein BYT27DRAFT_6919889 [Phlegmacium glaucopus]